MPRMPQPRRLLRALVFVALAALGLAAPALWSAGAQSTLGQPYTLPGDAAPVPAAGRQELPHIAKGADNYLAVWADPRTVLGAGAVDMLNPSAGVTIGSLLDIYAARLDASGQIIDTAPIVVSQAGWSQNRPRVAWNGQNYLVTWYSRRERYIFDILAARVSPEGQVLDAEPIRLMTKESAGSWPWPEAILTDADGNFIVMWVDFLPTENGGSPRGVFVSRVANDGTMLDPVGGRMIYKHPHQYFQWPDLARAGDTYLLAFEAYIDGVNSNWALPLDANFSPLRAAPSNLGTIRRVRLASNGDIFFAVMGSYYATRVSRAGEVLDPGGINLTPAGNGGPAEVAWDGTGWVVSHDSAGEFGYTDVGLTRASADGRPLGTTMLDTGAGSQTSTGVAPLAGGGAVVVWNDQATGEIDSARVSAAGAAAPAASVSTGAPRQSRQRLASNGNGFLAVFRSETSNTARILGQHLDADGRALDQEPFVVADGPGVGTASVAWNGTNYLAVWDAAQTTGPAQTFARVVPSSGPPAAPAFFVTNGDSPDVAALEGTFLVVNILQETSQIRTTRYVRVGGGGGVIGEPVSLQRLYNFSPRVEAFGGRWFAVWESHGNHDDSPGNITGSFISPADGTATAPVHVASFANDQSPRLAVAGPHALVVWHYGSPSVRDGEIRSRRINPDGTSPDPLAGVAITSAPDVQSLASVAWDGNQYIVTWADNRNEPFPQQARTDIYAARVSAGNVPLEEFPVASGPEPETLPTVVSANGLTLFAYAKFHAGAPYSSHRITLRAARFPAPEVRTVPAAPGGLFAEQIDNGPGTGVVRLTWRDDSTDEAGFKLEIGDGTTFREFRAVPADTTSADVSVGSGASNHFRVRAYNAAGDSPYSPAVSTPAARMVSPLEGTLYHHPAVVPLAATASDPNGVTRVEFYATLYPPDNSPAGPPTLVGTDTTPDAQGRYQLDWAAPAGHWRVSAKAFDTQGLSTLSYSTGFLIRLAPTATITAPADGSAYTQPASVTLTASAQTSNGRPDEYIQRLDFYAGDALIGQGASASGQSPWSFTWANAPAGTHSVTARATSNWGTIGVSAPVRVNVRPPDTTQPSRVNHAAAASGATATASSTMDANRPASAAINGDRRGQNWGSNPATGSGWHDSTANSYPDWLEVSFDGEKTIDELSVFSVQDNFTAPADPTEVMGFTQYGVTSFEVRYWDGAAWQTIPGSTVAGNNKVWRKLTFAPVTTSKVRVVMTGALAGYSRLTEVEAWGPATSAPPPASRVNHALAAAGATAAASSILDASRAALAAINGDRLGRNWGGDPATGSGWHDSTNNSFPDWLEVSFAGARTIDEVGLFSVQDNVSAPSAPTEAMAFTRYGVNAFSVEYWTGSAWAAVPGASVNGNNLVWRRLTFSPVTTTKLRVVVTGALAGYSRIAELEAWGPPAAMRPNVASAVNGATASASSTLDASRAPLAAINGDRLGRNWGGDPATGSGWHDSTNNSFPDWLEVSFAGEKTISEVSVFSVQDNVWSPSEPTEALTFTKYGLTDFDVEYWTGTAWAQVPGGTVVGNNKVWRRLTFAPVTTPKIRIVAKGALAGYSRVAEVEAF